MSRRVAPRKADSLTAPETDHALAFGAGYDAGETDGYRDGYDAGEKDGHADGYDAGFNDGYHHHEAEFAWARDFR
jgi:flagellar biosynthesis/type III secretory pathway protein FliH